MIIESTQFLRQQWRWVVLVLLAAALHLATLGERSLHHDESIHAKLSYDLYKSGEYRYDPTYHGPLLYYLDATIYAIGPVNDTSARLPIALAGIALVFAARGLRWRIGEAGALWSGILLTISPILLYYGRFLRMDILEAMAIWGVMLSLEKLHRSSGRYGWVALGLWTAIAVATKENSYVAALTLTLSTSLVVLVESLVRGFGEADAHEGPVGLFRQGCSGAWNSVNQALIEALQLLQKRWEGMATASALAILILVPVYTVAFQYPQDWLFPVRAIGYWWEQHSIQRVGGPWWFHLPRLLHYEFLILGAAFVWVMRRRSRLTAFERHLFAFGLLSILIYCYLGEKVPWLAVHQVWPFVPLAGAELARTFRGRGGWLGRCVASVALATTVLATLTANFVLQEISPSHGRVESLHFVQTTPEFTAVAREGRHLALASDTEELAVSGEATWPLSWYWRDLRVSWSTPKRGTQPALAIVDAGAAADVLKQMNAGYRREVVPLRAWWLMEASMPSVREIIRFLIAREPWGHVGSTDVVVLRRLDSRGSSPIEETEGIAAIDLNLGTSRTTTHGVGWLGGPRGVAVRGDRIAVADTRLSRIALLRVGDPRIEFMTTQPLNEPEDVAWLSDESLLIADTWNHRVLAVEQDQGDSAELMKPSGGWYGPRSIAVSPSGRIAVADTGNRRIVLYPSKDGQPSEICCDGEVPGLNEPGGLAWIDEDTLLVCDTGNRRLLVVDRQCGLERSVDMSMAWSDYYARPQITVLERDRWLVSDTPSSLLWLIEEEKVRELDLAGHDVVPTGLVWSRFLQALVVSDLNGRVWMMEVVDD